MEASAPAASVGGSAVVKMKPEAKERMKSQSAARAGDVAAHDAEGLAERAFDDGEAVHQAFALGNAAAARAVHADGMHFVEIGHRAVLVGEIAEFLDRRNVAIHRIDGFEGNDLRRARIGCRQAWLRGRRTELCLKMTRSHLEWRIALDHRSVVPGVRKDDHTGNLRTERSKCCPVGHVAGGEQKRQFLAVQIGELALEKNVVVVGARNIPGAARTRAALVDGEFHRLGDLGDAGPCRDSRWNTRR